MTIEQRTLDRCERLLWSGHPHAGDYAGQKGLSGFLFGLLFSAVALGAAYSAYQKDGFALLFTAGFVLVGLSMMLSPAWQFYKAKHTTYALTNRRALTDVSGKFPFRRSVPLHQIRFIELRLSDEKGVGNIYFQDLLAPGEGGASLRREGFIAIADAENVERLLRATIERLPDNQLRLVSP